MKIKSVVVKPYSKEESLLMSIVLFIIGVIFLTNPNGIVEIMGYVFGGFLVLLGILKYFAYKKSVKMQTPMTGLLVQGILYGIIGIVSIIFFNAIELAIRIVVAAYILYMGVNRLMFAISIRKNKAVNPKVGIILSSAMILFAVLLALTAFEVQIIGIFMMGYAVAEIAGYVLYNGVKVKSKDDVGEAIIVSEVNNPPVVPDATIEETNDKEGKNE